MCSVLSTMDDGQRIRVVVLDDEPYVGTFLKRCTPFQVEMAAEPAKVMARVESGRIDCDVWVVDINLNAEIDGFQVLDHLRRFSPATPVIMLSASVEGDDVRTCWRKGAWDYLFKPIRPRKLANAILEAHAIHHRPLVAELVGSSAAMVLLRQQIRQFATQPSSVLIGGETGTGKELVARALHALSARRDGAFVPINCGAVPPELIESELFGHVRGAFTNAHSHRPGLLMQANHGTLFLDEIGDMPLQAQVKLLRVLEGGEVRAVGSDEVRSTDIRVVAATHVDLQKAIDAQRFRQDLFYRLNVLSLTVPPLRDRIEDVPALAELFARRHCKPGRQLEFAPATIERLMSSRWPGNVRQLDNAIQRACALCTGHEILPEHLPADIYDGLDTMREAMRKAWVADFGLGEEAKVGTLRDARQRVIQKFMRQYLRKVLTTANGVVAEAARIAGLDRANFRRLLRKHEIEARDFRTGASALAESTIDEPVELDDLASGLDFDDDDN